MGEYTNLLKGYLASRRNINQYLFKIMGTIYRGSNNGRFTLDEGLAAMEKLRQSN